VRAVLGLQYRLSRAKKSGEPKFLTALITKFDAAHLPYPSHILYLLLIMMLYPNLTTYPFSLSDSIIGLRKQQTARDRFPPMR
jgi:hypothetical protein